MPRAAFTLSRTDLLRALPYHLAWAAGLGALAGVLLFFLNRIRLDGLWNLLTMIPLGALYVNAAVLPVVVPRRFWSLGFIGAMMLFLLLVAGAVLSNKIAFPHSRMPDGTVLQKVNAITYGLMLTGGFLGFLYGLMVGRRLAMGIGTFFGAGTGIVLGSFVRQFVAPTGEWFAPPGLAVHAAAFAMSLTVLHLSACTGAALGAGKKV